MCLCWTYYQNRNYRLQYAWHICIFSQCFPHTHTHTCTHTYHFVIMCNGFLFHFQIIFKWILFLIRSNFLFCFEIRLSCACIPDARKYSIYSEITEKREKWKNNTFVVICISTKKIVFFYSAIALIPHYSMAHLYDFSPFNIRINLQYIFKPVFFSVAPSNNKSDRVLQI